MASPSFGSASYWAAFIAADPKAAPLAQRVAELRRLLAESGRDPQQVAEATGARYLPAAAGTPAGEFQCPLWDETLIVSYPDFSIRRAATGAQAGREVNALTQALLAYYFLAPASTPPTGRWIAFSALPDGAFYAQAFQGYTGHELQKTFGEDMLSFAAAAQGCGGRLDSLTPYAYAFTALPRVHLLAACWPGDEDFATAYQILFDAAVPHHLATEACAILGGMLVRRLGRGGR